MSRKSNPTVITPEIQAVLDRWTKFAEKNNIRLAPTDYISDMGFKAKVCIEYNGACICKPQERLHCPCKECLSEVEKDGRCFCHIFVCDTFPYTNDGRKI